MRVFSNERELNMQIMTKKRLYIVEWKNRETIVRKKDGYRAKENAMIIVKLFYN